MQGTTIWRRSRKSLAEIEKAHEQIYFYQAGVLDKLNE